MLKGDGENRKYLNGCFRTHIYCLNDTITVKESVTTVETKKRNIGKGESESGACMFSVNFVNVVQYRYLS